MKTRSLTKKRMKNIILIEKRGKRRKRSGAMINKLMGVPHGETNTTNG